MEITARSVRSDPRIRSLEILGGLWVLGSAFASRGHPMEQAAAGALGVMTIVTSAWYFRRASSRDWDPTLLIGMALVVAAFFSVRVVQLFVTDFLAGSLLVLSALHARVPVEEPGATNVVRLERAPPPLR